MHCPKVNCKINKVDELMVSCWLCHTSYHAKCVELAARTADNLLEDKGLRWCCSKCKMYDIEFYTFFKKTRKEFDQINNDLISLTEKFSKYMDVFDNATYVEQFLQSPSDSLRKRKKTSEDTTPNKTSAIYQSVTNPNPTTHLSLPDVQIIEPAQPTAPFITANGVHSDNVTNLKTNPPNIAQTSLDITPSGSTKFYSPTNTPNTYNPPKQLKVVSSKKTIFAARFAADTTIEDVATYVKSKLQVADIELSVFKFKYTERRSKASFKIIVPEDVFDTIVNPDFWPPKAIIHEYIYRDNVRTDIAYLPMRSNDASKN